MNALLLRRLPSLALLLAGLPLAAEEEHAADGAAEPKPGHSMHGEAFNEGPRQAAHLMAGMPQVHFPVTTSSAEAQAFFDQGVGQLHGFWYLEAERSFRQAYALDTNCVMALWGMAMANQNNAGRAKKFIAEAAARTNGLSAREIQWIAALQDYRRDNREAEPRDDVKRRRDYVRALEAIVQDHPDDIEAKAFLVFQIWDNAGFGNERPLKISSQQAVDALLDQVFARDPRHPAHHYRIHLWDNEKPARALASAHACGPSGPGIAHQWHMPSHIFDKLARFPDAAWHQEASARVDHAQMIRDRLLPDQIHNYAHNNGWLAGTFRKLGRARDALEIARNLVGLPRHPRLNPGDGGRGSATQGRQQLLATLLAFELWDQLLAEADGFHLEPGGGRDWDGERAAALGIAALHRGDTNRVAAQLAELERLVKEARLERFDKAEAAETRARREKKPDTDYTRVLAESLSANAGPLREVEASLALLRAWQAAAAQDTNAVAEQLELTKDVPREMKAQVWWLAGATDEALKLAGEAAKDATNQVPALALHADLLRRAGRTNEAREAFAKLRACAGFADLDLPVFQRLQPLARDLGLPDDWRPAWSPLPDTPARPDLDTLGPRVWTPPPAPAWRFTAADGTALRSEDFRGRAVLLVFHLGGRCLHCVEQLNALAPRAADFRAAGLEILAVSRDGADELAATQELAKTQGGFPFPLASDAELAGFRAFRAYDDFEGAPLHGTFLVDGAGRLRWHDIGPEPFMEVEFLLKEAGRLLRQPETTLAGR